MYVAVIVDDKLIQVAKDGRGWKYGEIYDFALNKFKVQSNLAALPSRSENN